MHIADGVLPLSVTLASYGLTLAGLGLSLRRIGGDDLPKVAVVSSAFFVASLIHLPLGPTSVHLLLPGIAGALLGSAAFVAITVGLVLQSMLFQFGGLTALGANALMMGVPALICGWLFRSLRGRTRLGAVVAGTIASGGGVLLAAMMLAALLALAGDDFLGVAQIAIAAHLPVMLIEGLTGGAIVSFLARVKPELLDTPPLIGTGERP